MKKSLLKIFGEKMASEREADKLAYSCDASQIVGEVDCIVWPFDVEQIHQLVLFAKRTKTTLTPRGGGAGLCGGASPKKSIIVDMSKMSKILRIDNDKAVVQAGATVKALNSRLSAFYFPIVPLAPGVATFGGMIAVGAKSHKGRVSDYLLELKVVDGTGKFMTIQGDDLKSFCGKDGRTGIIVEATLKLERRTLMEEGSMNVFSFNTITAMIKRVEELKEQPNVARMEFLDEPCSLMAGLDEHYHLIVEFNDHSGNIRDTDEIRKTWQLYESVYRKLLGKKLTAILDPQLRMGGMDKFLYWLKKNNVPSYGSIGREVAFPHFKHNDPKIKEAISVVLQLGGAFGKEHGFGLLKKGLESDSMKEEMRELKVKYDSGFIMNGGKE